MKESQFYYDGLLVFNGIYRTNINSLGASVNVLEKLPKYTAGNPHNPANGFEEIELDSSAQESQGEMVDQENLVSLRYLKEEYEEEVVFDSDGNKHDGYLRSLTSSEAFWVLPDYLFIRGSKSLEDHISSTLRTVAKPIDLTQMRFGSDFLLWIAYKHFEGEHLSQGLSPLKISGVTFEGNNVFGSESSVENTTEATRNVFFIQKLLRGDKIQRISANFVVGGNNYIRAEISSEGRVHIKVSADLVDAPDSERLTMALSFLTRISSVYEKWQNLAPKEKYPPLDFVENLHSIAEEEGVSLNYPLDDFVYEIAEKRGEEPSNLDFNT